MLVQGQRWVYQCSDRDIETMLMTWQKQGQACLDSFILLAVLGSIPLSHTHTHACMHIPSFILARKRARCYSLNNTMPRQDESGDVRRTSTESAPHNKPEVLCVRVCVCLLGGVAVVCQTARGENEGESASCLLCEGFHLPIKWLFFPVSCICTSLVLFHSLHPSPFLLFHHLANAPYHNSPVLPPFFSLWMDCRLT